MLIGTAAEDFGWTSQEQQPNDATTTITIEQPLATAA